MILKNEAGHTWTVTYEAVAGSPCDCSWCSCTHDGCENDGEPYAVFLDGEDIGYVEACEQHAADLAMKVAQEHRS